MLSLSAYTYEVMVAQICRSAMETLRPVQPSFNPEVYTSWLSAASRKWREGSLNWRAAVAEFVGEWRLLLIAPTSQWPQPRLNVHVNCAWHGLTLSTVPLPPSSFCRHDLLCFHWRV